MGLFYDTCNALIDRNTGRALSGEAVLTLLAMTSLSSVSATRRDLSLSIEDAARATVESLGIRIGC